MTRENTVSAGEISVDAKEKLKQIAYESRMSQREILENFIKNVKIVPSRPNVKLEEISVEIK